MHQSYDEANPNSSDAKSRALRVINTEGKVSTYRNNKNVVGNKINEHRDFLFTKCFQSPVHYSLLRVHEYDY